MFPTSQTAAFENLKSACARKYCDQKENVSKIKALDFHRQITYFNRITPLNFVEFLRLITLQLILTDLQPCTKVIRGLPDGRWPAHRNMQAHMMRIIWLELNWARNCHGNIIFNGACVQLAPDLPAVCYLSLDGVRGWSGGRRIRSYYWCKLIILRIIIDADGFHIWTPPPILTHTQKATSIESCNN